MGLMTNIKASKAIKLQRSGKLDEARDLFEECYKEGMTDPHAILAYAALLLRQGEFAKTKEIVVKHQKDMGMIGELKVQLYIDYAACCFRLGETDKAVAALERIRKEGSAGLMYQTLGYLYVEKYQCSRKPSLEAFRAMDAEAKAKAAEQKDEAVQFPDVTALLLQQEKEANGETVTEDAEEAPAEEIPETDEQLQERLDAWWNAQVAEARAFLDEAIEYDDEDPICLDNMGQFVYRVLGDKAAAKEWFDKAIAIKPGQLDTLWFLSRYDVENGDNAAAIEKLEKILEKSISPLNYVSHEMAKSEIERLRG